MKRIGSFKKCEVSIRKGLTTILGGYGNLLRICGIRGLHPKNHVLYFLRLEIPDDMSKNTVFSVLLFKTVWNFQVRSV